MTLPVCVSHCSSRSAGHYLRPAHISGSCLGPQEPVQAAASESIAFVSKGSSLGLSQTGQLFSLGSQGGASQTLLSPCHVVPGAVLGVSVALFSSLAGEFRRQSQSSVTPSDGLSKWLLCLGSLAQADLWRKNTTKNIIGHFGRRHNFKSRSRVFRRRQQASAGLWPRREGVPGPPLPGHEAEVWFV